MRFFSGRLILRLCTLPLLSGKSLGARLFVRNCQADRKGGRREDRGLDTQGAIQNHINSEVLSASL